MASYNIEVIVDPRKAVKGSNQAIKSLGKVESSADRLRNTLRKTFQFASVVLLTNQIIQLTDAFTSLQNRIRVVTDTEAELVAITEELFKISQMTRSSFEGTVELYSRLAISSKELGVSMKGLTQFTKSMNEAIILSGASGREANAGLIQLSQGIASGALRGDELRSVLEQLPVVADVIAKQMGVTRGELRKLGETGSITAVTIIKAFENAREELAERFAKTVPTISQAFQVFRNSLVRNIGAFNQSNGAAQLLSSTLIRLANNMEDLLRLTGALVIILGVVLAQRVLPLLIAKIYALTAAIASNPIGAVLIIILAVVSALFAFGDKITVETGKLTTFGDVAIVTWGKIQKGAKDLLDWYLRNFGTMGELTVKMFKDSEFTIKNFMLFVAQAADELVIIFKVAYNVITVLWSNFANIMKFNFSSAIDSVISITEKGVNKTIDLLNLLFKAVGSASSIANIEIDRISKGVRPNAEATGKAIKDAIEKGMDFTFFRDNVKDILKDAEKLAIERNKKKPPTVSDDVLGGEVSARRAGLVILNESIRLLDQEIELLKLSSGEHKIVTDILKIQKKAKIDLTIEEAKSIASRLIEIELLNKQRQLYEKIKSPIEGYKTTLASLNVLLQQGRISIEEFNAALQATELGQGLKEVQTDLLGGDIEAQANLLRDKLNDRNMIIQQAREANLISEQMAFDLSLAAQQKYNDDYQANELRRGSLIVNSAGKVFGALGNLAKAYGHEQSNFYRSLFVITKAFAIADASIQIAGAYAKAANTPWPANIAAIAQVGALTAGIINTIASTVYAGGFKTGGDFTVGGNGAPDSKMVSFRATPGEQVSVRTPAQARSEKNNNQPANQVMEQTIINTIDPDEIISESSDDAFINKIQNNQDIIRNIIGG